ncbi:hypothetical protein [Streptomyces sp. B21-106]|uniref:hypothetical protein n=1 Tax=Streptomyces sp. B21-106 TaxID=3039418 RepID=UPI003FA72B14
MRRRHPAGHRLRRADARCKGGTIKRVPEHLNPRVARIRGTPPSHRARTHPVVLPAYVSTCPRPGRSCCCDRSWYITAPGVEHVMGFVHAWRSTSSSSASARSSSACWPRTRAADAKYWVACDGHRASRSAAGAGLEDPAAAQGSSPR